MGSLKATGLGLEVRGRLSSGIANLLLTDGLRELGFGLMRWKKRSPDTLNRALLIHTRVFLSRTAKRKSSLEKQAIYTDH